MRFEGLTAVKVSVVISKDGDCIICNSGLLDIVHRLYFNKITTFRKLNLLPSSGKKGRTMSKKPLLQIVTTIVRTL
jgi:hypothetical protein